VCFEPEEDCTAFAVDAIDRAETQILVNAYGLTTSSRAVGALVRAKQRGVDVKLIADRTTPCESKSGIDPLARAEISIWIDHTARIAHSKSMVIDGKVTLTGSMNWTGGAAHNSENLNLVASTTIAAAYAGHWHQRLALSSPYTQRTDCRKPEVAGVKSESPPRCNGNGTTGNGTTGSKREAFSASRPSAAP
jgi:phosphatidylserine/phosphatidylglycerophosphate/cardiolipin synthase-like enzyme